MEAYRQMLSQYRKMTRKRKLHLPPLQSVMAALMLLTRDEPEHTLTLRELTLHAIDKGFGIGWSLLQGLLLERGGTSPSPSPPANIAGQLVGMSGVLQALVLYWREDAPDPNQLRKRLEIFAGQLESGDTDYRHMKSARCCTCSSAPRLRGR